MRKADFGELWAAGSAVGRALPYPHDGDVAAAVDAACALVHDVTVGA
jgi:hypothetical protein